MSVCDQGIPLTRNFGPFSSDLGSFWGAGSPDYPLPSTPTALEAQALSFFPGDTTDIFHGSGEGEQPRRREGGRSKRKMSNREEPPREQPPKRRRETEPFPQQQQQPQYVAPHELVTSPSEMQAYQPLPSPREPSGVRRHASAGSAFDQRRPVEPAPTYGQSQYLQPPPESEWSRSMQAPSGDRPVLPSISATPGFSSSPHLEGRPPTSYSVPSIHSGYAPAAAHSPYERHASYSYASVGYDNRPQYGSSRGSSHSPLPNSADQSQLESENRIKPQCWEHGCNGKQFSTFSNLLRHQRERAGTSTKSYCPRCGAEFTRTTARNGHLAHAKCKPRRTPDPVGSGSSQQ